jgi:carboxylesterase type B
VNTFRYRYYGEFPNLRLTLNPPSGAWHGAEIPVVFQTAVDASQEADTPPEASISRYLHKVWAAFAKDPENALYRDPFGFPQYNPFSTSQTFLGRLSFRFNES